MKASSPKLQMSSPQLILEAVAKITRISVESILGRRRTKEIVLARQISAFLMRDVGQLSFPQIGKELGKRDHTTSLYSYEKIARDSEERPKLRAKIDRILEELSLPTISNKAEEVSKSMPDQAPTFAKLKTSEELIGSFDNPELSAREMRALSLYREGLTLEEGAKEFGITRERVRQIVQKSFLKELAQKSLDGYRIDVEEFIKSEKAAHEIAKRRVPERLRAVLLEQLSFLRQKRISLRELSVRLDIPLSKLRKFSEVVEVLDSARQERKMRWSKYYIHCRRCNTTARPHLRKGFCEQCLKVTRKPSRKEEREKAIEALGSFCSNCGIRRKEANTRDSRDLYLVSTGRSDHGAKALLCKRCFLGLAARKLLEGFRRHRLRQ
jgi:hypothetical protein